MPVFFFILIIVMMFMPVHSYAAAWTQEKGKSQLLNNVFLYVTDEFFDTSGNRQDQETFLKIEYNPYFETGVTDTITAGVSPRLQRLSQDGASGSGESYGLSEIEFFLRKKVWEYDSKVFSLQPLIKIPGIYSSNENPNIGSKQIDAEIRALFGHSFSLSGYALFDNVEVAYRKRFSNPGDEVRVDGTLGGHINDQWMVLAQIFTTFSADSSSGGADFSNTNSTDFDLIKLQLSAVKEISDRTSLQFGAFSHVDGENTGAGGGLLLSLWVHF